MFCKKSIWLALSSAVVFGSAFGQLSVTPALRERVWNHKGQPLHPRVHEVGRVKQKPVAGWFKA